MKPALAVAFAFAATAIWALCGGGAPGSAAGFPNITLTPSQGGVGTSVRVDGSNFCSSGCPPTVSISFSRMPVAMAQVSNGAFHATFQVPGGQSYGPHDVEADQNTPNGVLSAHRTFLLTISQTTPPTVPPSPRPPTPSPKPSSSPGPSAAPSDQGSPEPSASASEPAKAPIAAIAQQVPGGQALLAAAAIVLIAGAAVAVGYLWRRRDPKQ